MAEKEDTLNVPVWWNTGGGSLIKRECLSSDHPESQYRYMKNVLGVNPEDYGVYTDEYREAKKYHEWSKARLIQRVIELEKERRDLERYGFL